MELGTTYNIPAEPIKVQNTRFVDAGNLRIGVEPRHIDPDSLRESFAFDEKLAQRLEELMTDEGVDDGGVSLHVIGAEDDHEYLRFDCFLGDPHYHYIHRTKPDEEVANQVIIFDETAHGPIFPWALDCIRNRLPEMLAFAQGDHLIAGLDNEAIATALEEVEMLAGKALQTHQ